MDNLVSPGVERVARALCEVRIRANRRWDTRPEHLERILPAAIDASWQNEIEAATAAYAAALAGIGLD